MQQNLTKSKLPFAPLLLISPFFFWGTAMVAMKGVIPNTTPFFLAGVRLVPAGVLVLLVTMLLRKQQPQGWKAWLWIGLFGLVDGAMFQGFLAQGLMRTTAGLGSVMIDSQPLAVALMSWWLFQEKIGLWGWLGLVIGLTGISLIGLPDELIIEFFHRFSNFDILSGNFSGENFNILSLLSQVFERGEFLMLLAALSMAVGTVLVRWVCRYTDPVVATGWHMIIGGLPLFGLSGFLESNQWQNIDGSGWLALAYSTVFGSAVSYGLFFYFASKGSLTSLSALTFLTPVFALLFGHLFLEEVLSSIQSVGVLLTLVSIYLINQRDFISAKIQEARYGSLVINVEDLPMGEGEPEEVRGKVGLKELESDI
jgi:drug/metabolite transporter (DMT)-like permease